MGEVRGEALMEVTFEELLRTFVTEAEENLAT